MLNKNVLPGFEKKERIFNDGIRRYRFDEIVAMKSDLSNIRKGIADNGYCESGCFVDTGATLCVFSLVLRGTAVEDSRIS